MRLSKKIAAVALAAVMAVSMLTACGSTGGPSSSGSGSNSNSNSSSNSSSNSNSNSNSNSDDSSNGSSNSGTEDKNETIAYEKSRTAKFYQKLGTGNYTMNETMKLEQGGKRMDADVLVSTDGKRVYVELTVRMNGVEQTNIKLVNLTTKNGWELTRYTKPDNDGKLGYYSAVRVDGSLQEVVNPVNPVEGQKFKQETKGNYYIETQTMEFSNSTDVVSFVYEGNSSVPKYVEVKEYDKDGAETGTIRVEYSNFKNQAEAKYLDFESILENYNKR